MAEDVEITIHQPTFNIRPARPNEAGLILEFIKKLAEYEKCSAEVVAAKAL